MAQEVSKRVPNWEPQPGEQFKKMCTKDEPDRIVFEVSSRVLQAGMSYAIGPLATEAFCWIQSTPQNGLKTLDEVYAEREEGWKGRIRRHLLKDAVDGFVDDITISWIFDAFIRKLDSKFAANRRKWEGKAQYLQIRSDFRQKICDLPATDEMKNHLEVKSVELVDSFPYSRQLILRRDFREQLRQRLAYLDYIFAQTPPEDGLVGVDPAKEYNLRIARIWEDLQGAIEEIAEEKFPQDSLYLTHFTAGVYQSRYEMIFKKMRELELQDCRLYGKELHPKKRYRGIYIPLMRNLMDRYKRALLARLQRTCLD